MKDFEGFYIKLSGEKTVSFIFGRNFGCEEKSAFIQVITKDNSYCEEFNFEDYSSQRPFNVKVSNNIVSLTGLTLNINSLKLKISGNIEFGKFTKLKYNVMGPFKFLPFMECNHTVISMKHSLQGVIYINNKKYDFNNGLGYIEGDFGKSFPKKYFWTHSFSESGDISVFASGAIIPYLGLNFNGTVCVINAKGKEYRLASYLGAKLKAFNNRKLTVKQGQKLLEIEVLNEDNIHTLKAPHEGNMNRIIKESISATVRYKFTVNNLTLFDFTKNNSSFEYSEI